MCSNGIQLLLLVWHLLLQRFGGVDGAEAPCFGGDLAPAGDLEFEVGEAAGREVGGWRARLGEQVGYLLKGGVVADEEDGVGAVREGADDGEDFVGAGIVYVGFDGDLAGVTGATGGPGSRLVRAASVGGDDSIEVVNKGGDFAAHSGGVAPATVGEGAVFIAAGGGGFGFAVAKDEERFHGGIIRQGGRGRR
jgi:hypothetical protein